MYTNIVACSFGVFHSSESSGLGSESLFALVKVSRAVVFQLFQKMVILPPNPVGFQLTYTQLWDMYFFIRYVLICLNLTPLKC